MVSSELQAMLESDDRHWWYRGRRRVICAELDRRRIAPGRDLAILDVGCGSGRNLELLGAYGHATGLDASPEAVGAARARGHGDVWCGWAEEIPGPAHAFDLVTCLDVLEHTPDDRRVLRELRRVTRPDGSLVLTVPAYQALWSAHDIASGHFRRYRAGMLDAAAAAAGWASDGHTYFNSVLLPPAVLVRLAERHRHRLDQSDLALTPRSLDRALELPLRLEAALIHRGVRLPVGLSILAVYRNPSAA
jgi:SAM-dependent methyltransferase